MSTQPLEQAITAAKAVIAGVKPDQLSAPTPCKSWDVSALVNHLVGGQYFFATAVKGDKMPEGDAPDYSSGDFVAAFAEGASASVAAFNADGAMSKIIHLPFGDMPGAAFAGIAATDTFTHAWDLAKATGQSTDLSPALAAGLLEGAKTFIPESFRGPEPAPFGPIQTAPAGACNADQLAAFLGRTV